MWGRRDMHEGLRWGNLMATDQLEKPGVNDEIHKNGSERNNTEGRANESRGKGQLQVEGWWEHGYEPSFPKTDKSLLTS